MFGQTFDFILGAVCLGLCIPFFLGKGRGILNAFTNKNDRNSGFSDPDDERGYQRCVGIFLVVIGAMQLILAFFSGVQWLAIVALSVVAADFAWFIIYTRKKYPMN